MFGSTAHSSAPLCGPGSRAVALDGLSFTFICITMLHRLVEPALLSTHSLGAMILHDVDDV